MNPRTRWETEEELFPDPSSPYTEVLVCMDCGAILKRRVGAYPGRDVGTHTPGCPGAQAVEQRELFA